VESIELGGIEVLGNQVIHIDSNGDFVAKGLVIPGLDPGFYSLIITVGNGYTELCFGETRSHQLLERIGMVSFVSG